MFLVIVVIGLLSYLYLNKKITNIYVTGNNLLKEQTIIELAGLDDYPKLSKISKSKIKKNLLTSPFISDVLVKIDFTGKITLEVLEYQVLCINSINEVIDSNDKSIGKTGLNGKLILSNGEKIYYDKDIVGLPVLINDIDESIYDEFIAGMIKIKKDVLVKISEIKYDPNGLDDERFLFYMTDQNYVYITLSKIDVINTYNEISPTLEGKKGILYLDSGNHFQIKK